MLYMAAHCNTCWQLSVTPLQTFTHGTGRNTENPLFSLVFYNSQKYTCGGLHFPHSWSQFFHVFQSKQYLHTLRLIFQLSTLEVTMAMLQSYCVILSLWGWLQCLYSGLQAQLGEQDILIILIVPCSLCVSWNKTNWSGSRKEDKMGF